MATAYLDDFYVGDLQAGATRRSGKDTRCIQRLLSPSAWGDTAVREVAARGGVAKRCCEAYTSQMCAICRRLQKQGASVSCGTHACASANTWLTSDTPLLCAQLTYRCGNPTCGHLDARDGASARCLAARARVDHRRAVMGAWVSEARVAVESARAEVERVAGLAEDAHMRATRARTIAGVLALVRWMDGHTQENPRVVPPIPWPPDALVRARRRAELAEHELARAVAACGGLDDESAQEASDAARVHAQEALTKAREVEAMLQRQGGYTSGTGVVDRGADASEAASSRWCVAGGAHALRDSMCARVLTLPVGSLCAQNRPSC